MTDRTNADFLQVLQREAEKDPLIYLVLAERRLIPFEAQAPQPTPRSMTVPSTPPCAYHRLGEIACAGIPPFIVRAFRSG